MARAVYSTQLLLASPSAPNLSFEVPDGYVCVIRDIDAYQDIGAYGLTLRVADSTTAPQVAVVNGYADGVSNTFAWRGRIVLPPLGYFQVYVSDVGTDYGIYVGGYLLSS